MHYQESANIQAMVKGSSRVLVNCHVSPDPDCVASALAVYKVLTDMGKAVDVVCPNELPDVFCYMLDADKVQHVDPAHFRFDEYDLFITVDTSSWEMVSGLKDLPVPHMQIVVIDHHATNTRFGAINVVDTTKASATEVLYAVFEDWGVAIEDDTATLLLTGIIGDTGSFQYSNTKPETLMCAAALMRAGADREKIAYNLYQQHDIGTVHFIGAFAANMQVDEDYKFVWTAIDYQAYAKIGKPTNTRITDTYLKGVKGTELGVRMIEEEPGHLKVSFRARNGVDVAAMALALGGGGHKAAAGATVTGLPFAEAVKKVLRITRTHLQK